MKDINISSLHLKTALLYYYRFKRGYLCSDEVYSSYGQKADILVDTGKAIYEIEIKLNKADLYKEKKKTKHKPDNTRYTVNKFSLCVPTELVESAKKWIKEVNPKYGLIEFNTQYYTERKARYNITQWDQCLRFIKKSSNLNKGYNKNLRNKIIKRLPSALCNAYISQIQSMERKNV